MTTTRARRIRRLSSGAALAAVLALLAGVLAFATLTLGPAPEASAARQLSNPTDVFTGSVAIRRKVGGTRKAPDYAYTINVARVFRGDHVTTQRVMVDVPASIEPCRLTPLDLHGEGYVFQVRHADGRFTLAACDDLAKATTRTLAALTRRLGEGRPPVVADSKPPLPDVTTTPRDVGQPASFTKTAAPGGALVIVGLLGLVLARRRRH